MLHATVRVTAQVTEAWLKVLSLQFGLLIRFRLAAYPSRYAPLFGGEYVSFCDRGAATTANARSGKMNHSAQVSKAVSLLPLPIWLHLVDESRWQELNLHSGCPEIVCKLHKLGCGMKEN
jgi:hypothetical protein